MNSIKSRFLSLASKPHADLRISDMFTYQQCCRMLPREQWRQNRKTLEMERVTVATHFNASDPTMLFCSQNAIRREQNAEALRRIAARCDRMNDSRAVLVFWLFVAWLAVAFALGVLFIYLA